MNGHTRKRGKSWEVVLELGAQDAQRCPSCMAQRGRTGGRLLWVDKGRHDVCPTCGGALEDVTARRQITLPERFRTKKEAEARCLRERHADMSGAFVEPAELTLRDYLENEWLPSLASENLAANTVRAYTTHVRQRIVPILGAVRLQKITSRDVARFSSHLATHDGARGRILSPATRQQALVVLHKSMSAAVRMGHIRTNPAHGVARPKVRRREMQTWTAEQLRAFLEGTREDRLYPLWRVFSQTGLRRGEVLGLRWEDVDLAAAKLTIRRQRKAVGYAVEEGSLKTDRPRAIPVDGRTADALRQQSAQQLADADEWGVAWVATGHVFTRENGEPWHPDRISKLFDQAVAATPVPRIRLHDLRHTWATLALRAGVHPKVVQERLGHANIAMTMDLYSHVLPDMQEAAAEMVACLVDTAGDADAENPEGKRRTNSPPSNARGGRKDGD